MQGLASRRVSNHVNRFTNPDDDRCFAAFVDCVDFGVRLRIFQWTPSGAIMYRLIPIIETFEEKAMTAILAAQRYTECCFMLDDEIEQVKEINDD
jgi:hypothetical protein